MKLHVFLPGKQILDDAPDTFAKRSLSMPPHYEVTYLQRPLIQIEAKYRDKVVHSEPLRTSTAHHYLYKCIKSTIRRSRMGNCMTTFQSGKKMKHMKYEAVHSINKTKKQCKRFQKVRTQRREKKENNGIPLARKKAPNQTLHSSRSSFLLQNVFFSV